MDEPKRNEANSFDDIGERLAAFSVRKPVTICMLFVSIVVMGLISAFKIPLVMLPTIAAPQLNVNVPYPNATPEQILESITKPLEEAIATIPGIERMSSDSGEDSANIRVFSRWGADIDLLRSQVRETVDQVRPDLPEEIRNINIRNFSTDDIPVLAAAISSERDLRNAYDFIDLKIKKPLERVPGVGDIDLWGAQRHQLDIYLRVDDVKRYSVNVGDLFQRLDEANLNTSIGQVGDAGLRYSAVSRGVIKSVDDVADFPVNDKGLVLSDIADIEFGNPNLESGQLLNGENAIGFQIRKTSEANTVDTVARVHEALAELSDDPSLGGIETHMWHDGAKEIVKGLRGLLNAGIFGAILAVATLLFFLPRFSLSLMIGLAIPFSVISAVGFLYLTGNTLNMLSMMGLMLSTGMLVDNAVVVLESIYQKLEKGLPRQEAARRGSGEVTTAVVAATLTSIIIFVPIVFGEATNLSTYLSHTGRSIILALLCSLFISLTLIPVAMARFLRVDLAKRSPWRRKFASFFEPVILRVGRLLFRRAGADEDGRMRKGLVTDLYLHAVAWPLRHRFSVGLVLTPLIVAGATYVLMNHVPDNSADAQTTSQLRVSYEFSENYHYVKIANDYVAPVEAYLVANKAKLHIKDYMSRYRNGSASTDIYFDTENLSVDDLPEIRKTLTEELPVIPGADIKPGRQGENQNWINASIYGDDPSELSRIGSELKSRLLSIPKFSEVFADLDEATEEVQIRLRRDEARKYGVSPESVSQILGIVVRARQLRGFRTPDGEVEMWVRLDPSDLQDMNDLKSIVVGAGSDGKPIELRHVADFSLEKIAPRIRRENRRAYTSLDAVYTGDQRADGQKLFTEALNNYSFPDGYGWSFGFWTKQQQQEDKAFLFNILLALFMVYFVMASLFESLAHPFAIMFSLPFAVVGVAGFLWATGTPFNIMAMIGTLVLIGIVVNNGIVLIDHINNLRRRGFKRSEAILEGCRERLRPIVMTAATTIVGLAPLAFGDTGLFDLRYYPMARTIMGGLMASTILTLVVLPTYYTLMDDLAVWFKGTWAATGPASGGAEQAPEAVAGD